MKIPNEQQIGSVVQAYVKAKFGDSPDEALASCLGAYLDPQLKERVDILGFEGEKLLDVDTPEVLATLAQLEDQAAREDAHVRKVAVQVRANEAKGSAKTRVPTNVRGFRQGAPRQAPVGVMRSGRQRQR